MVSSKKKYDDEIDLIEIFKVLWTHKLKYLILGTIGLMLGLVYDHYKEERFITEFRILVGHPLISSNSTLIQNYTLIKKTLNDSELTENLIPKYYYNPRTASFTIISDQYDVNGAIKKFAEDAVRFELNIIKGQAQILHNKISVLFMEVLENTPHNPYIYTDSIAEEEVMQTIKISIGKTKIISPDPLKSGVIGVLIGMVLAFFWMLFGLLLKKK